MKNYLLDRDTSKYMSLGGNKMKMETDDVIFELSPTTYPYDNKLITNSKVQPYWDSLKTIEFNLSIKKMLTLTLLTISGFTLLTINLFIGLIAILVAVIIGSIAECQNKRFKEVLTKLITIYNHEQTKKITISKANPKKGTIHKTTYNDNYLPVNELKKIITKEEVLGFDYFWDNNGKLTDSIEMIRKGKEEKLGR